MMNAKTDGRHWTRPSNETIAMLADMVMAGQIVEAALTDGTFVLLMEELKRRGMVLQQRTSNEKNMKPFLYRVGQSSIKESL
jgi:hypothetical protein